MPLAAYGDSGGNGVRPPLTLREQEQLARATAPLLARIAALEARVRELEDAERAATAARAPDASALDGDSMARRSSGGSSGGASSAQQSNPAHKAFWTVRGYSAPPWGWPPFRGTPLGASHAWPGVLSDMAEFGVAEVARSVEASDASGRRLSDDAVARLRELIADDALFSHLA